MEVLEVLEVLVVVELLMVEDQEQETPQLHILHHKGILEGREELMGLLDLMIMALVVVVQERRGLDLAVVQVCK